MSADLVSEKVDKLRFYPLGSRWPYPRYDLWLAHRVKRIEQFMYYFSHWFSFDFIALVRC